MAKFISTTPTGRPRPIPSTKPFPKKHHDLHPENGHTSCILISAEEAVEIIRGELQKPTITIIKNIGKPGVKLKIFTDIETLSSGSAAYANYTICGYLGEDETRFWKFQVDHLLGIVTSIQAEKIIPKSEATKIILEKFKRSNAPSVFLYREKIASLKPNDFTFTQWIPKSFGGWGVYFKIKGIDGSWRLTINLTGKIVNIDHEVP